MIDRDKIFADPNAARSTNINELLSALIDPANSIEEKREIWRIWQNRFYNLDDLINFFNGTLFGDTVGPTYDEVMCKTENYKNFYELAMSLDMANLDRLAYYLYWILSYHPTLRPLYSDLAKEAFEYDPDTIHSMLPEIEEVIFAEE